MRGIDIFLMAGAEGQKTKLLSSVYFRQYFVIYMRLQTFHFLVP